MITDVAGKRILIRVDFNVPLDANYNITDTTRIDRALPTITSLLDKGASVILMSHFGRPQKKRLPDGSINKEKFTLRHLVPYLSKVLGLSVNFVDDCIGEKVIKASNELRNGNVLLLENTRFYEEEKNGDDEFAAKLSKLADLYINDAFGAAHRAHASTSTVAKYFKKENRSFGLLMEQEIANAKKTMNSPDRPCVAIFGGAKVSDKIKLIERFMDFADTLIIGGGMSYTFFKAMGGKIGSSLCEDDYLDLADDLIQRADSYNVKIVLPQDSLIADNFSIDAKVDTCSSKEIPDGWMGLDIGPEAIKTINTELEKARTIIWNGPLGVFEMEPFSQGTLSVAKAVASRTEQGAFSLIGGGDSVAAINKAGLADKVSFISTGGGALLEFLEGKKLPGIQAILAD